MNKRHSFFYYFAEAYERYRAERRAMPDTQKLSTHSGRLLWLVRYMVPNIGTVFVVIILLWAQSAGALPLGRPQAAPTAASTGAIAYQGRLADANGNPLTGTYNMIFRLYAVPTGGIPLWEEQWTGSNGVRVSDGLFNVMLGSLTPIQQSVIAGREQLWLGITVGTDDEMQPRVQLGSVPFAVQALTVPDGSITTAKIADGAVTQAKINIERGEYLTLTTDWDNRAGKHRSGLKFGEGGSTTYGAQVYYDGQTDKLVLSTLQDGVEKYGILIDRSTGYVGIGMNGTAWPEAKLNIPHVGDGNGFLSGMRNDLGPNSFEVSIALPAGTGHWPFGIVKAGSPIFRVDVNGNVLAAGSKSAVVQAGEFGQRKLYSVESPEVRFFDEGLARLKGGVARVELDPIFLETIEGEYLVHVTPYGDASLYVAEVGKDYFVVRAREGDPNIAFAWRLSAHRKGYAGVRLERVEEVSPMR